MKSNEYTKLDGEDDKSTQNSKKRICCGLISVFLAAVIGVGLPLVIVLMTTGSKTTQFNVINSQGKSRYATGRFGSVASDQEHCSYLGTNIMAERSGSSVDAAVVTMLCLGVLAPMSSGIGGGHIMLIYERPTNNQSSEKIMEAQIAREMAPRKANKSMFYKNTEESMFGGKAIAVPGQIHGLYKAWEKYGRVSWKKLLEPVIALARDGFPVQESFAKAIIKWDAAIRENTGLSKAFIKPDGNLYQKGDILKRPQLARSLEIIAEEGEKAFYNGSLTPDIMADLRDHGSIIDETDLLNYFSYFTPPIKSYLKSLNLTVFSPPPPSSGVTLQLILQILDHIRINKNIMDFSTLQSTIDFYHILIEILKFGSSAKTSLGDPAFNDMDRVVKKILADKTIKKVLRKMDLNQTHDWMYYEPETSNVKSNGTTHISIISPDGGSVSVTTTINLLFGSRVRGLRTGIIFNDQMNDFAVTENTTNFWGAINTERNEVAPLKRPQSSTCGSIFVDDNMHTQFVIGASGGTKIPAAVTFVTVLNLWLGYDIDDAINAARLHHQLMPNIAYYESNFDKNIIKGLLLKGHDMKPMSLVGLSVVQAIRRRCKIVEYWKKREVCLYAVSDFRKFGAPDAY